MPHPFAFLSATRGELLDLYRALMAQSVVTNAIREEQHQEAVGPSPLLQKIELLLELSPERAHEEFHRAEDDLWEYSWYTYTDEWAWNRARQDVLRTQRKEHLTLTDAEREQLIETQYKKEFDRYSGEIDMHVLETTSQRTPARPALKRQLKKKL